MMGWQWHQLDHMQSFAPHAKQITRTVPRDSDVIKIKLTASIQDEIPYKTFLQILKIDVAFCNLFMERRSQTGNVNHFKQKIFKSKMSSYLFHNISKTEQNWLTVQWRLHLWLTNFYSTARSVL